LFHVKINVQFIQRPPVPPKERTNQEKIEENLEEPSLEKPITAKPTHTRTTGADSTSSTQIFAQTSTATATSGDSGKFTPPGRNDPCPCGSGKKYKKCHGA
jgi:uncharacterized protein YecA (UPF0149 family)